MIDELIKLLASYEPKGFQPYLSQWQRLDAFSGKLVDVISGEQRISGLCCGVADNGALIIDIDGVEKYLHGGELSLRLNNES
jgi:BirA family biotin operon repressor/biotin-[acetyl-CoA-carboxylase] ligase